MRVGDISLGQFGQHLAEDGLDVHFGPFSIRIQSKLASLTATAHRLYHPYPVALPSAIADFHVHITQPHTLRRFFRRQCLFELDGRVPFAPYAEAHAFPALEWGINWCIATRAHHLLMLHAGVVERGGMAILFPAWPGHGKSTLTTALAHCGWRLLSDEFGLVRPEDGLLQPIPRLIPLKNQSIDVIGEFCPHAIIGPRFLGTRKGTVAHVRPPATSIERAQETARPRWLVFPRWVAGAPLQLQPMPKSQAFLMVATNAFNYDVLDASAFRLVTDMVNGCDCYSLIYSDLAEAIAAFEQLAQAAHV